MENAIDGFKLYLLLSLYSQILSEEIGCDSDEIIGMELNVCDTQPSCLGGGNNEFIYSGRLDNLASCYCALRSLMDSSKMAEQLSNEKAIRMVAMFDNEEVRCIHKSAALHEPYHIKFYPAGEKYMLAFLDARSSVGSYVWWLMLD